MARLITEGFEAGVSSLQTYGFLEYWSGGAPNSGSTFLRANYGNNWVNSGFYVPGTPAQVVIKFALAGLILSPTASINVQNQANSNILSARVNGSKFDYYVNNTFVASGRAVYSSSWTVYEFKVTVGSSGSIEVRIGGQLDFVWSGNLATHTGVGRVDIYWWNGGYNRLGLDDVVINTIDASEDGDWPGDRRILGIVPNGNGSVSGLIGSDGNSIDNYLLMDDRVPNRDTDYVQSSTPGSYDLYALSDPSILFGYQVKRIILEADARQTVAENDSYVQIGVRLGSTEDWGDSVQVNTNWQNLRRDPIARPGGGAWALEDINALEAGVKVVS